MSNKFPIGSQWTTRAGHRAVVVDEDRDELRVYHQDDCENYFHSKNGECEECLENSLITPWQEPRKGTFWVNVYGAALTSSYGTKEEADKNADNDRLACVCVDWQEGQGLEDK